MTKANLGGITVGDYLTTTRTTSAAVALSPSSTFTFVGIPLIWAAASKANWAAISLIQ